ncbi:uncharacterized protein BX663DRAFT_279461 [Cokeromyces recurvatus]|uniref:uncharacterized protein n=1 Tax=Cokeromyces recurvatus TaxID=90255 RepID=UPI00221F279E|nr:uncharacterized protein BX663DRAFT_279461 [Cokeromyces recurvatus]KAI7897852.1 hypothetical protein BX663DRAFT_279461 [Cokeromyces recurvatus]
MNYAPIHHTLENAIITYDIIEQQNFQKDLVKDVFFSPAIDTCREMSPQQSDNESDIISTTSSSSSSSSSSSYFSSQKSPSELLLDNSNETLFDFGLDLATISTTDTYQSTTSSYEEVMLSAVNKNKPTFTLSNLKSYDTLSTLSDLPTPPASSSDSDHGYTGIQTKRRCSDSVLQDRLKKKKRSTAHLRTSYHCLPTTAIATTTTTTTLPIDSPYILSTLKQEDNFLINNYNCFDEGNFEQVQNRSSLEDNRFDSSLTPASEFRQDTFKDEDTFSTTSWEEEGLSDSCGSEDEAFVIPSKMSHTLKSFSFNEMKEMYQTEQIQLPKTSPRPTAYPTIYQKLTKANIDWCRYCGTTEGVNWRPGPWGKRTLCNKHGCDYKGYGFACKLPRLDLTEFINESIHDRKRPVLQLYCSICQRKESWEGNVLVRCEGCPKAYHQKCHHHHNKLNDSFVASNEIWFCDATCAENAQRKRIIVELPRKRLPLMRSPKNILSINSVSSDTSRAITTKFYSGESSPMFTR